MFVALAVVDMRIVYKIKLDSKARKVRIIAKK